MARVEWWKPVYPGTIDEEGRDELASGKRTSSSGNRGDCMRPPSVPNEDRDIGYFIRSSWSTRNNGLGLDPKTNIGWTNPRQSPWTVVEDIRTFCSKPLDDEMVAKFKYSGIVVEEPIPYVPEYEHTINLIGGANYRSMDLRAMEDSGAAVSFVALDTVERLGLRMEPSPRKVILADNHITNSLGRIELTFQFTCYRVRYWFEVMAIPDFDVVLGRDIMNIVGLHPVERRVPADPPLDVHG